MTHLLSDQTLRMTPPGRPNPWDDTSAVRLRPRDDTPPGRPNPRDDTPPGRLRPQDNTPAVRTSPQDDTPPGRPNPQDDTPPVRPNPRDDTPHGRLRPQDNTPAVRTSPSIDDQCGQLRYMSILIMDRLGLDNGGSTCRAEMIYWPSSKSRLTSRLSAYCQSAVFASCHVSDQSGLIT